MYRIMSLLSHQVEYLLLELVEDLQLLTLLVEASLTVLMVLMTEYRHSSSYLSTLQVIGRLGTSTGDVEFNSVGSGFSTPTFTFNAANDTTTVESINDDYQSGGVTNLDFTLFGAQVAAVPEPSTWAMMLLGFGILGFASYYKKSLVSA